MNTTGENIPLIKLHRHRDYEIALDDLEFAFHRDELEEIKELHNSGCDYKEISKSVKRDPYEVIIALLHLVKKGHRLRSFWEAIR